MALTLEEKHEKDKKYAEEALGFIKAEWAKVNAANETAKNVEAEVKITIGKYLVNKFFKGEWERTNEKEPKAARVGAWKELLCRKSE